MFARRDFLSSTLLAGAGLALRHPSVALAAEDPYLRHVHPDLRKIAAALPGMTGNFRFSRETLPAMRAGAGTFSRPQRNDIAVEKRMIPGARANPDVAIHIVNPKPGEARPAILHMHGGGFVVGSAMQSLPDLQDICAELGCVGLSVDYRLAPETTYEGSIEDNYSALKWLHANAADIGADPARIAVMGESAGGGHAALLAIVARDRGEVPLAFQCLTYPMLDDRTGTTRKTPPHVGKLMWTAESNAFGWECFLGRKPGGRNVPPAAVPARIANLAGLPQAFIGVGSLDLFHDEDVDYAQRLNAAGVSTELIVVPGAFHGFDTFTRFDPKIRVAGWFNAARLNALRIGLGLA